MATKKTIVTVALVCIALCVPLSVFGQSRDFQMNRTVLVKYKGKAAQVTIPAGVTAIGDRAFDSCTSITSVTIPSSVSSIGGWAFWGCTSLTSVTIAEGVTSIGRDAFSNCTSLTSVTIPSSVTSIGFAAFSDCTSLTSVTIPESVTSIGEYAFYGCPLPPAVSTDIIKRFGVVPFDPFDRTQTPIEAAQTPTPATPTPAQAAPTPENRVSFNNIAAFKAWLNAQPANTAATAYNVKLNVNDLGGGSRSIGNYTPNSVGNVLYTNSAKYVSLDLSGSTLTSVPYSGGSGAFENCRNLTSITLPESVTSIGSEAFRGCGSLTSITIPTSVTSIGLCAFIFCNRLTSVTFAPGSAITKERFGNDAFPPPKRMADPDHVPDNGTDYLKTAYLKGGAGTYTRTSGGSTWTKQ